jgi:cholesterol transport system auxiliary component
VTRPSTIAAAALLAASLGLSGCITVFPKAEPVQLYRFGEQPPQVAPTNGQPFNVTRSATLFARAAQGDAILTSNGAEIAYIAGARWISPAVILFDEAVDRAFNADGGPVHLVPRGETGIMGAFLKLDVEVFEARYSGPGAPTATVRVRAVLARASDRSVVSEKTFDAESRASDNRMGAIVQAYDQATTDVIGQIVAWTEQQGETTAGAPPAKRS